MEQSADVQCDGQKAEFKDELTGEEKYQLFVKKHAEIPYDKQKYCPDNVDYRSRLIPDFRIFLKRLGIKRADVDSLSCIHVAGTKGKGSTCAMTERILRTYGYKTGLISSPPLLEVRERVRINGVPVSRTMFGRYSMECLELLEKNRDKFGETFTDYPGPFGMFTIVAYYILVKEKVDVAVVEVGLGGEYDSTNIIWSPTVTGVSSLAIEHVSLLGDTLAKISWHKAGVFKDGRPAFTVAQKEEAMKVLVERAKERNATLQVCPPLTEFECNGSRINLGLAGKHQRQNAALAVQLTKTWLEEKAPERVRFEVLGTNSDKCNDINGNITDDQLQDEKVPTASAFVLPDEFLQGFELSKWPGRNQTIKKKGVTFYIDNAHTKDSVAFCKNWFEEEAYKEAQDISGVVKTVLIFNLGGDRDALTILPPLVEYGFDAVVFSVMRTVSTQENEVRDYKHSLTLDELLVKCEKHLSTFKQLYDARYQGICTSHSVISSSLDDPCHNDVKPIPICKVAPSALDAVQWAVGPRLDMVDGEILTDGAEVLQQADHLQVLVTGSNFMVGSVIHVIEPNMLDKIEY